ncbi:MAG: aldo/keto reductase, partial [Acidobacteriota bacterium]
WLEGAVDRGLVGCYGVSSERGFRSTGPELHDLYGLWRIAEEVAGSAHHFGAIQLPLNTKETEGIELRNHSRHGRMRSTLEAADELGCTVVVNRPFRNGQTLVGCPPEQLVDDVTRALEFVCGVKGVATVLVGMRRVEHVERNLSIGMGRV